MKFVKIYKVPWAGKNRWEIRYKFGGRWHRHKRTKRTAAELLAAEKETLCQNGASARYRITDQEATSYERMREHAAAIHKTVEEVFYRALDILRGEQPAATAPAVAQVVEKFIADKRGRGLSDLHLDNYTTRLGRLAQDFRVPINHVAGEDLKAWLDTLPALSNRGKPLRKHIGPRTRNNYQSCLVELFTFAREKKYLTADWSGLSGLQRVKTRNRRLIFSPEEMKLLVEAANDRLLPAIVLGGFAGLRTSEIERLRWEDIDWDNHTIFIAEDITKNEKERFAPLLENAARFLSPWREGTGPVNTYRNLSNQKARLAHRCGLKWKHNALRHSFATYRTAILQGTDKVKLEIGTSASDLSNSYLRSRWVTVARKYFLISPKTVTSGILQLKFA